MNSPEIDGMFDYDPDTGYLTWLMPPTNSIKVGQRAGSVNVKGYRFVTVAGKRVQEHRLAWRVHYGVWPKNIIDHINGDAADNRMRNLREATKSQNNHNAKLRQDNVSGIKGVCWCSTTKRWVASIGIGGKRITIGCFDEKDKAINARREAASRIHGAFARGQ